MKWLIQRGVRAVLNDQRAKGGNVAVFYGGAGPLTHGFHLVGVRDLTLSGPVCYVAGTSRQSC